MLDETNSERGMSLVVKMVARWLTGFVLLFGVYMVLYGHDMLGGGFAGAAAIASGFILLTPAFGHQLAFRKLGQRPAAVLSSTGVLIFLGLAVAGLFFANTFFENMITPPEHGTRSNSYSPLAPCPGEAGWERAG